MNNDEYIVFLKETLEKIENIINFLKQDTPKHVLAYHKALGVQQKMTGLGTGYKEKMFPQLIIARSIISYLINGKYEDVYSQTLKLKGNLVKICLALENEKNKDK